jgi:hypothetical protein
VAGQGRHLGNLATLHSPLGDRALYRTLICGNDAANGCSGGMLTVLHKNISQSVVNAGYLSQGQAAFDRMMLDPKGWYWRPLNRTCQWRITIPKIGSAQE